MAKVLFNGSVTGDVVRFGIRQHSSGYLRAASPCCMRSMEGGECKCKGCGKEWRAHRPALYNLTGDVKLIKGEDIDTHEAVRTWARAITGHATLNMEVTW